MHFIFVQKQAVQELRDTYIKEKKGIIESDEKLIQMAENQAKSMVEKDLDSYPQQDLSPKMANFSQGFGFGDQSTNKAKLADYDEAFRKIYVSFKYLIKRRRKGMRVIDMQK